MRCPKCQTINEAGSRFCGGCGADLAIKPPAPPTAKAAGNSVYCQRCGTANPAGSRFCESCGNTMGIGTVTPAAPAGKDQPSGAWWLLPIFLAWLGGIIAWAVVKDSDPGRARKMLATGFIVTFILIGLSFLLSALAAGLTLGDFSFD